jgi:hypothetical protein
MKLLFKILLFCPAVLFAQTKTDSLEYVAPVNKESEFTTKFDKQISTYVLTNNIKLFKSFNAFDFALTENYSSTFIRSSENNVKDEHFFSFKTDYSISPDIKIGFGLNNNILSDNRKIEINNASQSDFTLFGSLTPETGTSIIPYFGYSNNRQIGENDYGYVYGFESQSGYLSTQDLTVNSILRFKNEDINPRKNFLRYFNVDLKNVFNEKAANSFSVFYTANRKDFYYTADTVTAKTFNVTNNIQSRIETNYYLQDRFLYNGLFDVMRFDLTGNLSWREIDKDTRYRISNPINSSNYDYKINELKFELQGNSSINLGLFEGNLKVLFSEHDEKHIAKSNPSENSIFKQAHDDAESEKNNTSLRSSVSLSGLFNFSKSDKLIFSLFQNKLSYNTPSDNNNDDRDELYSIIRARYNKTLSPLFSLFVNAEADFNHIVYIFSERSSNNNLNRVIKLSSGSYYTGKNFSSLNTFEVSANYTVYDFEALNANLKSYSFRQYSYTDSSVVKLTDRLSFVLNGSFKLSEQGQFSWSAFSTHPTQYLAETYLEPKLISYLYGASFALGIRYFSLDTYKFNNSVKYIDSRYKSVGPLAEIIMSRVHNLSLNFKGYYEIITTTNNPSRDIPNLNCDITWNF